MTSWIVLSAKKQIVDARILWKMSRGGKLVKHDYHGLIDRMRAVTVKPIANNRKSNSIPAGLSFMVTE